VVPVLAVLRSCPDFTTIGRSLRYQVTQQSMRPKKKQSKVLQYALAYATLITDQMILFDRLARMLQTLRSDSARLI